MHIDRRSVGEKFAVATCSGDYEIIKIRDLFCETLSLMYDCD